MTGFLLGLAAGLPLWGGLTLWVRRGGRTAAPPRPCSCWACFDPFHDRQDR